jgi:HSP20 family molecular chaperone IbpA
MKFNHNAFALACASLISIQTAHGSTSPFESMQKALQSMDEAMQSMFDNMNKMHEDFSTSWKKELSSEQEGVNIAVNQEDNAVKVILTGIQADQFDATFGNKELTIKTSGTTINLSAHNSLLSISMNQEISQETTDQEDQNKKMSRHVFASSSHVHQPIAAPVIIEDAAIDYTKDTKTLTITLPAQDVKKAAKVIPVNIK